MRIGTTELLMILLVVIIIFGPKQLPKLAKMVGKASKSFKEGMEEDDDEAPKKAAKTEDADAE
ncbi:MAG: twin-arginine translocase TatA/TatE family subunit [Faecalibacterium sp.]|nr:twin-arginine translocase TatA/TatE family subunit [Faecalibacterium sp.]